ncbi:MAG TPA: DNA alkylation repair protein [Candidatus Limnocylindria bacterium]
MDEIAAGLERTLADLGTPERAASEKRYLKSDMAFLGATVWQTERVVKDHLAGRRLSHDDAVDLAVELWSVAIFERRMAAVMVLERSAAVLAVDDLPLVERLVRESGTWALVDGLAGDVVARIVEADPDGAARVLDRWAGDPDFWVRRASLLAELRALRKGAPLDRFVARADPMLEEREFFIRKAIGWVLREAGKRRPDDVAAWLAPRTHRASGVTIREAVKYLPPEVGESLMTAYREKRPAS